LIAHRKTVKGRPINTVTHTNKGIQPDIGRSVFSFIVTNPPASTVNVE
jgi:hypothetical protein